MEGGKTNSYRFQSADEAFGIEPLEDRFEEAEAHDGEHGLQHKLATGEALTDEQLEQVQLRLVKYAQLYEAAKEQARRAKERKKRCERTYEDFKEFVQPAVEATVEERGEGKHIDTSAGRVQLRDYDVGLQVTDREAWRKWARENADEYDLYRGPKVDTRKTTAYGLAEEGVDVPGVEDIGSKTTVQVELTSELAGGDGDE